MTGFACLAVLLLALAAVRAQDLPCAPDSSGTSCSCSIVIHALTAIVSGACVCNATYCDTIAPILNVNIGQFAVVESSHGGLRFNKTFGTT
jgi:hypothetical protein